MKTTLADKIRNVRSRYKWFEVLLLLLFICLLGWPVCNSYQHAADTKQQMIEMQDRISDFNQKAIKINNMQYRPIQPGQIGDVQQNIVAVAQQCALEIVSLKRIVVDETGQTYEIDFTGSWANSAYFLENIKAKDALIGLRSLSSGVENGVVHTVLQYKIYTK